MLIDLLISFTSYYFFNLCIYFIFFFFFYFTILYWFCHTSTWIHHGCTRVPNLEPPSHLLPHTISLGHPSAPAPSILYPASNLDWQFVSYMILYMFQCHSPKSSHPLPLPQSPKDCSICLCLSCCFKHLKVQFSSFTYIHMVVQLSSPFISRTFSLSQTETPNIKQ